MVRRSTTVFGSLAGLFLVAGCSASNAVPAGGATEPESARAACAAVSAANELMTSIDIDEQETGRVAATRLWTTAETDGRLADWLRRECGAETLAMVRSAGLQLVGGALRD